jgi:replication factor C small subunit
MSNKSEYLFVEKYRPSDLSTFIGNEQIKSKLARFIIEQDIPHLLFCGKPGTGKTTIAKILVNHIDCDYLFINASDENNIETVRNKIKGFVSTHSFKPLKIVILDEADYLTASSQAALRNLMEQFSKSTRFILTANYGERISDPIVSRVQSFTLLPSSPKDVCVHVAKILKTENVEYLATDIKTLIETYYPDIRKIINEGQLRIQDGKFQLDIDRIIEADFKMKLVSILKSSDEPKQQFIQIRQLIANSNIKDFIEVYQILYSHVDEYAKTKISDTILAIAEGQFQDSFVVDKEITFCATVIRILQAIHS